MENKLNRRLKKGGSIVVGIYVFYAALLLLFARDHFPLMPYGIVFGAGLVEQVRIPDRTACVPRL